MTDIAAQTPLPDLLRKVPAGERLTIEHSPTSHSFIPIGRMAHEAAAEIERLRAENDLRMRQLDTHVRANIQLAAEVAALKDHQTSTPQCPITPEENEWLNKLDYWHEFDKALEQATEALGQEEIE